MPDPRYALGLDYGTNSVRALIADIADGREAGSFVWPYQRGEDGVFVDPADPHLARQHPLDYFDGYREAVQGALRDAGRDPDFRPERIVGMGVDTTGSTPIPVDKSGSPLALEPSFEGRSEALAWLWKDHTAWAEAEEITDLARRRGEPYLAKCGGTYSSEWFWSKILRAHRAAPDVAEAAYSWVECQDLVPGWLAGETAPLRIPRGICAAGHKAMYSEEWGGLPSESFLAELDPRLAALRNRLYTTTRTAGERAGVLTESRAADAGLPSGTPISVGAFDAHLGAVGAGVRPGTLVKIMGTSTCDVLVGDAPDIPGVCGIVPGSVIPGRMGIEAGQSAVGDLFQWCARHLDGGPDAHRRLNDAAAQLRPGQSGLLALDWNNGNRTILVDPMLTGLLVGQTLHTTVAEIYRALIESTAFGARKILERIEEYGVRADRIVVCGGIAAKSPLTLQIYADVCGRPIETSRTEHTCALGACIAGSVAGGAHPDFETAIEAMTGTEERVFRPDPAAQAVYEGLFELYSDLHDAFGVQGDVRNLFPLMKRLLAIAQEARR